MITDRNYRLKAEIIEQGWQMTDFALALNKAGLDGMDIYKLSHIIAGRRQAKPEEVRMIAWKLQKPISALFPQVRSNIGK
ncbi:MAG: hypothetical protein ACYSSO_13360 [Planctomycetota bacterium]|jgi:hypothetical protein